MAGDLVALGVLPTVEWSCAGRSLEPGIASGDRCVASDRGDGVLLAVVDGLGHGSDAFVAARAATAAIELHAAEDLAAILHHSHAASARTRGSAVTVLTVSVASGLLRWIGIGNVAGLVIGGGQRPTRQTLRSHPGILGTRLPPVVAQTLTLGGGETIVLASDGIDPEFESYPAERQSVGRAADGILAAHARPSDDALVLVARYVGTP